MTRILDAIKSYQLLLAVIVATVAGLGSATTWLGGLVTDTVFEDTRYQLTDQIAAVGGVLGASQALDAARKQCASLMALKAPTPQQIVDRETYCAQVPELDRLLKDAIKKQQGG